MTAAAPVARFRSATFSPQAGRDASSPGGVLGGLEAEVPPALVDRDTLRRLVCASERLFAVTGAGFECRLAGDAREVDLGLRIAPEDGSAAMLAGCHPGPSLPAAVAADLHWQRVIRICRLWGGEGLSLRPFVDRLCVEIDRREADAVVPQPSLLFFDLIQAVQRDGAAVLDALLDIFLPLARGAGLGPAQRALMRRVYETGRRFGALFHCGVALARDDRATGRPVRLVFCVQRRDVSAFLAALGFDAAARRIGDLVHFVGAELQTVLVQIDVAETLGSRIGIDLMAPAGPPLKSVIKALIDLRLCGIDKALGLADWLDYPPGSPATIDDLGHDSSRIAILKHVNHFKLAISPDRPVEAKAYLYAAALIGSRTSPRERTSS